MSGIYEELLDWQRRTKGEAGGDISQILHRYCRFMAGHGVELIRATMALTTLHPQIQALRYVWFDDERDPGKFPSPALFLRRIHHIGGCTIDEALMSGMRPVQIRELALSGFRVADRVGVELPPYQRSGRRAG